MANDFLNKLTNPEAINSAEWSGIKTKFTDYRNSRLSQLGLTERRAKSNYATFTTQARNQLTQAVKQLKGSVETDALRRGLSHSTIHDSVVGSETERMKKEIGKQTDAAKSALEQTVAQVRAQRRGLAKMEDHVKQIDNVFTTTSAVSGDVVEAMSGDGKVDYSVLKKMAESGANSSDIDTKKKELDEKQNKWDSIRSMYSSRNDPEYAGLLGKWMEEQQGLSSKDKDYDETSTVDTLGNRVYWAGLASFNALTDTLKADNESLWKQYGEYQKLVTNHAPEEALKGLFPDAPTTPDAFNLGSELSKNGLLKDKAFVSNEIKTYFWNYDERIKKKQIETADLLGVKKSGKDDDEYYKDINTIQADWDSMGYHYDANDPQDVDRYKQKLPPKSFLSEYSDSEEDQQKLKGGKLPTKVDNTLNAYNRLIQFYNELANHENSQLSDYNSIFSKYKDLSTIENDPSISLSYLKYLGYSPDTSYSFLEDKVEDFFTRSEPQAEIRSFNQHEHDFNNEYNQYVNEHGITNNPGILSDIEAGYRDPSVNDVFSGIKFDPEVASLGEIVDFDSVKPELIDAYEKILTDILHNRLKNGTFGNLSGKFYQELLDSGHAIYELSLDPGMLTESYDNIKAEQYLNHEPMDNLKADKAQYLYQWAAALGLDNRNYPQSDSMLEAAYVEANQADILKNTDTIEKGRLSSENELTAKLDQLKSDPNFSSDLNEYKKTAEELQTTIKQMDLSKFAQDFVKMIQSLDFANKGYANLSDDESNLVNYYYGTGDIEIAETLLQNYADSHAVQGSQGFAQAVHSTLTVNETDDLAMRAAKKYIGLYASLNMIVPAIAYTGSTIVNAFSGKDLPTPESYISLALRSAQAASSSVSEGMTGAAKTATDIGVGLLQAAPFIGLYLAAPELAAIANPWLMAFSTAGQTGISLKDRGASGSQQLLGMMADGLASYLFAKTNIGSISQFKPVSNTMAKVVVEFYKDVIRPNLQLAQKMIAVNILSDIVIMDAIGNGRTKSYVRQLYEKNYGERGGMSFSPHLIQFVKLLIWQVVRCFSME